MEILAEPLENALGSLLLVIVLTVVWSTIIRASLPGVFGILLACIMSLMTASVIYVVAMPDLGIEQLAYYFGRMLPPQLAAFLLMVWQHRRQANREMDSNDLIGAGPSFGGDTPREKRGNFIIRHWRGDLPLGVSYWGINLFVWVVAVVFATGITNFANLDAGFRPKILFYTNVALWTGIVLMAVWQIVGLWRSAQRHAEQQRRLNKTRFWARAAQFMAIVAVLQNATAVTNASTQIVELYRIAFLDDPDLPPYEVTLLAGGNELSLQGGIKYGLAERLSNVLASAPEVTVLHLTSTGGRLAEANQLAQLVRDRGLTTYVSGDCLSACTLIFAAGKERWLALGARLGYHGAYFPGLSQEELNNSNAEWAALYKRYGVNEDFVARALRVPHNEMWYPDTEELLRAGIITGVDTIGRFAISGNEAAPTLASIERQLRESSPQLDALHTANPEAARRIYEIFRVGMLQQQPHEEFWRQSEEILVDAIRDNLLSADDEVLANYAALMADQYAVLLQADPELCFRNSAYGDGLKPHLMPDELIRTELHLNEQILRTAKPRPPVDETEAEQLLEDVLRKLSVGELETLMSEPGDVPSADYGIYCAASESLYRQMSQLDARRAALLMRYLNSQG
ncbi:hypothetical protein FPY71_14280 [Aureimonas fodinaquatilis]|uniref:Uncharacterized protein n=1 Tax=Aureimonas fodinaquatilis TaxID=2565783 RepID=A0A5B0DTD2_9HYPH|nr:hypothetical protein [Aureimonas fodinaquatilis]KAA0969683.1 hypothetical protein FPY71_14280 [Aureimonas fodinaquatilis]